MRLKSVEIKNFRAIGRMQLALDPCMTVLHGDNALGKTSVLRAISVGLAAISDFLRDTKSQAIKDSDKRHNTHLTRVLLTTIDGVSWERSFGYSSSRLAPLREHLAPFKQDGPTDHVPLPIYAYYDTDRAVFDAPQRRRNFQKEFRRFEALKGALEARTDFRSLFEWFYSKQFEEQADIIERRDFAYGLKDLDAVRQAIYRMIPGTHDLQIKLHPLRFAVGLKTEEGKSETLSLEELSGGYRIMLALVADLARRMAQGNPQLDDPLQSEAMVLIDEVDLHLHPAWQQRVLEDLMRTFPNTQFIVTTHSPQVLSTVRPDRIVRLRRIDGEIVATPATSATYGAEAGQILQTEMGVSERPPNEFSRTLRAYFDLIDRGEHHTEQAQALRCRLEELSPQDSGLERADIEIRKRQVLESLGRKP